jgi:hypothetical protein
VIDLDCLGLSHADRTCHGLIHESRGPVGADKDNMTAFLEIETNATRLEL